MNITDKIDKYLTEAPPGTIQMKCNKCGNKFKTKIGKENTANKCPKCGDTKTKITHVY